MIIQVFSYLYFQFQSWKLSVIITETAISGYCTSGNKRHIIRIDFYIKRPIKRKLSIGVNQKRHSINTLYEIAQTSTIAIMPLTNRKQKLITIYQYITNTKKQQSVLSPMKPLYFCTNCKQYHANCTKQNLVHSSSIKYLRFSELFNEQPHPHLQNFTANSPRMPENSRLVYREEESLAKIRRKQGRTQIYEKVPFIYHKDSRVTSDFKTFSNYSKNKNKKMHTAINLSLVEPRDISRNLGAKPEKMCKIQGNYDKNIIKTSVKKQRGPYYLISKVDKNHRNQQNQKFSRTQQATQNTQKKTLNKSSYVYGDSNRQILMPNRQVNQFSYGDLVQSQEEQELPFKRLKGNNDREVKEHTIRISTEAREQIAEEEPILKGKNDQKNQMDQLQKIKKIHEKNKIISKVQQQNFRKNKSLLKEESTLYTALRATESKLAAGKSSNSQSRLTDHLFELKTDVRGQGHKRCTYFDNRCLGFSFCDQGQISFIEGRDELL